MRWGRPRRERRDAAGDTIGRAVLTGLERDVSAPDFTGPIMARLGYRPADHEAIRREHRRRLVGRGSVVLGAMIAIGAGLATLHLSGATRRPTGPTVPAALGHDVQLHQDRVTEVLRSIRRRTESALPAVPLPRETSEEHAPPLDEDVDRSALAAVSWV